MVKTTFRAIALAGVLLSLSSLPAGAQGANGNAGTGDPKDYAVIALVGDTGFGDATGLITRYKSGRQRNVVTIRRSTATSLVLERAMQMLSESRRQRGQVPKNASRAFVMQRGGASTDPATQELFRRLLAAPSYQVWGVGNAPAISVRIVDNSKTEGNTPDKH